MANKVLEDLVTEDNVTQKGIIEDNITKNNSEKIIDETFSNNDTCGIEFRSKIKCTRYSSQYGPVYWGNLKLANYESWNEIILSNIATLEQKEIIVGMSENEGNIDGIQSYDSEIITVGAMQKTVNINGSGELVVQLSDFKKENPDKFKKLFENCGWSIKLGKIYYNDITGDDLKILIRKNANKNNYGKVIECIPLEPMIKACYDEDYQKKQVIDFIKRLEKVLTLIPTKFEYKISEYVSTKLSKATVLDQHINRPAYVVVDFAKALNKFFKNNPAVSKNPTKWGANFIEYEKNIIDDYGVNRRGTDMINRYKKLKNKLS